VSESKTASSGRGTERVSAIASGGLSALTTKTDAPIYCGSPRKTD